MLTLLKTLKMSPVAIRHAALERAARRFAETVVEPEGGVWVKPGAPLAIPPDINPVSEVLNAARSRGGELDPNVALLLTLLESSSECRAIFESYGVAVTKVEAAVARRQANP